MREMTKIELNYETMKSVCLASERSLVPEVDGYNYIDNGSKILAVAHCDFVRQKGKPDFCSFSYKGNKYVMSETLDDRLGVYIITQLLPSLGIITDILLTTGEETGHSSAKKFTTDKKYNWIFSFDRRGTDVVAYCYHDTTLDGLLKNAIGVGLSRGSYSDIASMEYLGVKGLNFGTGYFDEHSASCSASESSILTGVNHFIKFWRKYKNKKLEHTKAPVKTQSYSHYNQTTKRWENADGTPVYNKWDDDDNDGFWYRKPAGTPASNTTNLNAPPTTPPALPAPKKEEPVESADGTIGLCDYCERTAKLYFSYELESDLCEYCLKLMSSAEAVNKDKKPELIGVLNELPDAQCEKCEMPSDYAILWDTMVPSEDSTVCTMHTLCIPCKRWIEDHVDNEEFRRTLKFEKR